jgi:hypothetical protein
MKVVCTTFEPTLWRSCALHLNLPYEGRVHYIWAYLMKVVCTTLDTVTPVQTKILSKPKTCLSQTNLTVPSTKFLCNLNLCKPNTCLNWTISSVPKGFGLDRFYCIYIFIIFIEDLKTFARLYIGIRVIILIKWYWYHIIQSKLIICWKLVIYEIVLL